MNLDTIRRFALSLPEAAEQPHFELTSFRVRGKIFATAPADGGHLNVFVEETTREQALALHGGFVDKLFWGRKAVGLRVTLARATPAVVEALLREAWARKAPRALATDSR